MNSKAKTDDYVWPVFSEDDPSEEGFRILARIILKIMREKRAKETNAIEQQGQLNYEI